jgi:hypothetical protein
VPAVKPANQRNRHPSEKGGPFDAGGVFMPGEDPRVPAVDSHRVRPTASPEVHDRLASASEPWKTCSGVEPVSVTGLRSCRQIVGAIDLGSSNGLAS